MTEDGYAKPIAAVLFTVTVVLFGVSWHLGCTECEQSSDCAGANSTCVAWHCECDVYSNPRPWRCDPAARCVNPVSVAGFVFLVMFLVAMVRVKCKS